MASGHPTAADDQGEATTTYRRVAGRPERAPAPRSRTATGTPPAITDTDRATVLSMARRIALQTTLASAVGAVREALLELLDGDRLHVWSHDPESGMPWGAIDPDQAPSSITAWGARAPRPASIARVEDTELYRPEVDDPDAEGGERLLVAPLRHEGQPLLVIVAVRRADRPEFAVRDLRAAELLLQQCAAFVWQIGMAEAASRQRREEEANPLFRDEALERHRQPRKEGHVVEISPTWVAYTYRIVLTGIAIGLAYALLARVNQYSSGTCVIRIEGAEVAAHAPGNVVSVQVQAGQRVQEGDLLVQLRTDVEQAEYDEARVEYERQLATFLYDPSDSGARTSLASSAARLHKAGKVLEARAVRAPRAGVISDVRVRPGSALTAGDHLLTIVPDGALPTVVALLPGGDRPRLRRGMTLNLELPGYEKTRERTTVSSIGDEVIGPQEAKRYLGEQIADALKIEGPVVLVRAQLASRTFEARGKRFEYHDGMVAKAETVVRSRRALLALLPALEKLDE